MVQQARALVLAEDSYDGSQPSKTPVPGDPTPSSELCGHWAHTCVCADKTLIHINLF